MSNELSTEISPEIINSLILTGDMSKLTPTQQTQYYTAVCKSVDINPLTQPFAIIVLQGKKTLYATKGCTQQLCANRRINTEVKDRKTADSIYIVSARATMPDGRFTDDDGIVSIVGLKGAELANAMMKAVTKAKRRAVLALCGLGMPDEIEIDQEEKAMMDNTKSRLDNIIDAQSEVVDAPKEETKPVPEKEQPKEQKKTTKKEDSKPVTKPTTGQPVSKELAPGYKLIQGTITEPAKYSEIGEARTPKWLFIMGDLKLGTFDKKMFESISAVLYIQNKSGVPILLNIEYEERISGDKTLRDIINFSQCVANKDVPI